MDPEQQSQYSWEPTAFGLTIDETRSLDQVRMRLTQLTQSMQSLAQSVATSNPLPDPTALQSFHSILQKNLLSITNVLDDNSELFSRIAVHPSTQLDGRKYENVLLSLIRKKLDNPAEIWAEEGRAAAIDSLPLFQESQTDSGKLLTAAEHEEENKKRLNMHWKEQEEVASRVQATFREKLIHYATNEDPSLFTREEKESGPLEHVRTGLRRDLAKEEKAWIEGEYEKEEDEDEEMENAGGMTDALSRAPQSQAVQGNVSQELFWYGLRGDNNVPRNIYQPPPGSKMSGAMPMR